MRAIPCLVALAFATPALAQTDVLSDVSHPLVSHGGAAITARTIAGYREPGGFSASTFTHTEDGFRFHTEATVQPSNCVEFCNVFTRVEFDLTTTVQLEANYALNGSSAAFEFTGPGVSIQHAGGHSGVAWVNGNRYPEYAFPPPASLPPLILEPGTYHLSAHNFYRGFPDLPGRFDMMITVPIPEPSTWLAAAGALVVLSWHLSGRSRRSDSHPHRQPR